MLAERRLTPGGPGWQPAARARPGVGPSDKALYTAYRLYALVILLLTGCSTFDVGRYGVSVENVTALKKLNGQKVSVGTFTAKEPGKTEIPCRAVGPITTPDKKPFEQYIRQALIDELTVADMFADSAPVTLTGELNKVDFNSMAGEWELDLTMKSSNGQSLNVSDKYKYGFTYMGATACARTAKYFGTAVQNLIGKLVYDPKFAELLK